VSTKSRAESIFELVWGVGIRIVVRIALWLGLAYFLWRARSVLTAVLIAAILTYAMLPAVDYLCSYRIRGMRMRTQRLIATTLVFVLLLAASAGFAMAFVVPIKTEMVGLKTTLKSSGEQVSSMFEGLSKWYSELPDDVRQLISDQNLVQIGRDASRWVTDLVRRTFNWVSHLVDIIIIPVLAFYFTLGSKTLKREFVALVPRRRLREVLALLHEINCIMRSYVVGQIILCLIAGLVVAAVLSWTDIKYVFILSLFAGISRAIPIVGPIVSGMLIVLLGLAKSPWLGLNLFFVLVVLHFVESKFIMPVLIGDRMNLHPALILIFILIGYQFFGIAGMFLAAPVAAILRVVVRFYVIKPPRFHMWGLSGQRRTAGHKRNAAEETQPLTESQGSETAIGG